MRLTIKMVAACREFRRWALNHKGEFALLFGLPRPSCAAGRCCTERSMEVFGHMSFALEDPAPMFEIILGDLASLVGLRYPLPQ